jgi:ABC-2 type transport system ATP-binding protein
MGFSHPQSGNTAVNGRESWTDYDINQRAPGFLPGEIALPASLTRTQFLNMMADFRGISENSPLTRQVKFASQTYGGSMQHGSHC